MLPAGRSLELTGAIAGPASSFGTKGKDVITDEFLGFFAPSVVEQRGGDGGRVCASGSVKDHQHLNAPPSHGRLC